ncbi:MAG: SynChlorMet cassette radical SAM/SPASM protein ScmF [Thermoanaerobaculaceae bacterium]
MSVEQAASPAVVPPLRTLYVYLTGGCNLACRHCWLAPTFHPDGGTGGHLPYELFERAIDEAIPLGLQGVKLTGGEPFLHPELFRLADLLRKRGLDLTIETNGTLVTEDSARALRVRSTLTDISVSIDGSRAEVHDPFRGVAGSFDRAVAGFKALVAAGYRPQVIMSLHCGNADDVEPAVRLAESLGASSVKFNLVQPSGRGEHLDGLGQTLDVRRLIELGRWVEGNLQPRCSIRLLFGWPMAFHSLRRLAADSPGVCGIHTIVGLLPSGHLALCGIGEMIPELCFGLVGEVDLADVWRRHPTLLSLRRAVPSLLQGVCARCLMRETCLGSCVAQNYHETRCLTTPFWFCHQAEVAGAFPVSRLRPAAGGLHCDHRRSSVSHVNSRAEPVTDGS